MIPEVKNPKGIRTPDYLYNGTALDRKAPTGGSSRTIKNNIEKANGQASWVVLNITDCKLSDKDIDISVNRALGSSDCDFVETLIIIKDNKIIKMFERI